MAQPFWLISFFLDSCHLLLEVSHSNFEEVFKCFKVLTFLVHESSMEIEVGEWLLDPLEQHCDLVSFIDENPAHIHQVSIHVFSRLKVREECIPNLVFNGTWLRSWKLRRIHRERRHTETRSTWRWIEIHNLLVSLCCFLLFVLPLGVSEYSKYAPEPRLDRCLNFVGGLLFVILAPLVIHEQHVSQHDLVWVRRQRLLFHTAQVLLRKHGHRVTQKELLCPH